MRKFAVGFGWGRVVVVAGALLSLAAPAAAQSGRVLGRVTDGIGNPVPHAEVVLVPADSGAARRTATTGETGGFDFPGVPPGRYTLRAAAPGFRPRELLVELRGDDALETVIARLRTDRGVPRLAAQRIEPAPSKP